MFQFSTILPFVFGFCIFRAVFGYFNFAIGTFYVLGLYALTIDFGNLFFLFAYLLISVCLVLILHYALLEPMRRNRASDGQLLIATLGIYIVGEQIFSIVFGESVRFYVPHAESSIDLDVLNSYKVLGCVISGLATSITAAFILAKTEVGARIGAVIESETLSKNLGLNVERIQLYALLMSLALVMVSGLLAVHDSGAFPRAGFNLVVIGFAISLLSPTLPKFWFSGIFFLIVVFQYGVAIIISSTWTSIIVYSLLLTALVFRARTTAEASS